MPLRDADIAIAITVYRPNETLLQSLIAVATGFGGPVLVHVDGATGEAIEPSLLAALRADSRLSLLQTEANAGIGAGLNRLVAVAEHRGCQAILFFDQDSTPTPDMARRLGEAFDDLDALGYRPAAVGPALGADPEAPTKVPHYRDRPVVGAPAAYRATDFLITSGSLTTLAALSAIGGFEARYRMDAIDVEWCFRAWSKGYSVWCVPGVTMRHRVGEGIVEVGGLRFPRQSTARMQSYARNQFHLLRLAHIPARWKLRTLVYVPLQLAAFVARTPRGKAPLARRLLRALADGLTARFDRT